MLDMETASPVELYPGESDDLYTELTLAAQREPEEATDRQLIPAGLDEMMPGPFLAMILGATDVSRLTGSDVVTVLRAQKRQTNHHEAGTYSAMAEVAHCVSADTTERSPYVDEYAVE